MIKIHKIQTNEIITRDYINSIGDYTLNLYEDLGFYKSTDLIYMITVKDFSISELPIKVSRRILDEIYYGHVILAFFIDIKNTYSAAITEDLRTVEYAHLDSRNKKLLVFFNDSDSLRLNTSSRFYISGNKVTISLD